MCLVDLDWTLFIAHHEFLEGQKAEIPTITFLVSNVLRDGRWVLQHWADLELPDAAIDVTETVEWAPVF